MYKIKTYNKISKTGLEAFDDKYTVGDEVENADGAIVRSAALHDVEFPASLKAIARAGAGTNNIPIDRCSEQGIVVFNTPGANANAVKELVIAALLLSSRKIVQGIEWAKTLVGEGDAVSSLIEKGKSNFAGPEIQGKTLGVVGLGAIGRLVANAAFDLGMKIVGYDPFLNDGIKAMLPESTEYVSKLSELYAASDYITLHLPCVADTKNMINASSIAEMKDGVRILNFARGELVNSADLKAALSSGKVAAYITDFPSDELIGTENVTALPHLGASTPESEENCAFMAATELREYLEKGNIKNSVNLPNAELEKNGDRLCVIHRNTLGAVNDILAAFSSANIETNGFVSKSKGDVSYTIVSAESIPESVKTAVESSDEVIKVRLIK